jgi:DNA-directed RNA polymerase subunit M/transcription elongation factor TFIIS
MSRERFTLVEGGKGRKPKRRKVVRPECGRCQGRAFVYVFMPTEQADGSPGTPRRHRACVQCLSQGRVELI